MARQLTFPHVKRTARRAMLAYVGKHAARYTRFAEAIKPDLSNPEHIRSRVAFAILSANTPFDRSVQALAYCQGTGWIPDPFVLAGMGLVPSKAGYVRKLREQSFDLLRGTVQTLEHGNWVETPEAWNDYRLRLRFGTPGLGLAKASFAACLLYPLDADLACIDTWVQRVILGHTKFHSLSLHRYQQCEAWIRRIARRYHVPTFVAQWLIWDSARGTVETHNIFPGRHKGTEWMLDA